MFLLTIFTGKQSLETYSVFQRKWFLVLNHKYFFRYSITQTYSFESTTSRIPFRNNYKCNRFILDSYFEHQNEVIDIIMVSLLLTSIIFPHLFPVFLLLTLNKYMFSGRQILVRVFLYLWLRITFLPLVVLQCKCLYQYLEH